MKYDEYLLWVSFTRLATLSMAILKPFVLAISTHVELSFLLDPTSIQLCEFKKIKMFA